MQPLNVVGDFAVTVPVAATEERDKLLRGSACVTCVRDPADQEIAVAMLKDLRGYCSSVEKARKAVKEPVLKAGRTIDELAAAHVAQLETEADRIGRLIAGFQAEERARVRREEEARQRAIREQEARELEAKVRADAEARALDGPSAGEAELARAINAEATAIAETNRTDALIRAPLPEVRRESGMVTREVLCWECTDVHALYKAAPHLVRLEPNAAAIKATCVAGQIVPGLKLWKELKTGVRL